VDTTITTLEFCAGYGGIGLGLKNIFGERMRTIAYCELEGYAQANLLSKMEKGLMDVAPLWNDLKTFPYESFHGLVDILIAGYPCQPFSSAGKRAGKEDPRHLWPWIADGIQLLQPRMCFFENVEGHISLGLSTVISDLEELGYKSSFGIFSASEVGAVHQRKRVFIMAHRKHARLEGFCEFRSTISWTDKGSQSWDGGSGEELAHNKSWTSGGLSERAQEKNSEFGFNCEAGIGNVWPSRPGQPQYAWEPPRVVGTIPAKLANFCAGNSQQGGDTAQAGGEGTCERGQGEDAMPHGGSSLCGGDQGDEPPRVVGNATSKRSCGGSEDGANQQPEMLGTVHEAVGNSDCGRLSSGIDTRSCSETDSGGQDNIKQTECGKIEPEMGRDIDGTTYGVDIAELSGLCHSELAEICEWMVKGDNRTDELRSCGNGVVPATAERAFRVLMEELINK
jgi:site-specific DNA-cytosine methylase